MSNVIAGVVRGQYPYLAETLSVGKKNFDYDVHCAEENVSTKVVKIIQSYTGVC